MVACHRSEPPAEESGRGSPRRTPAALAHQLLAQAESVGETAPTVALERRGGLVGELGHDLGALAVGEPSAIS